MTTVGAGMGWHRSIGVANATLGSGLMG
jgi:hypothetical protein